MGYCQSTNLNQPILNDTDKYILSNIELRYMVPYQHQYNLVYYYWLGERVIGMPQTLFPVSTPCLLHHYITYISSNITNK